MHRSDFGSTQATMPPPTYTSAQSETLTHGGEPHTQRLQPTTLPPELTNALEHMSGQLDIITQVRSQKN